MDKCVGGYKHAIKTNLHKKHLNAEKIQIIGGGGRRLSTGGSLPPYGGGLKCHYSTSNYTVVPTTK